MKNKLLIASLTMALTTVGVSTNVALKQTHKVKALTSDIQQHKAVIEDLKETNENLEAEVNTLQEELDSIPK